MESKKVNGKKVSKKEARQVVYNKIFAVLSEFKPEGKAKKFEDSLRRTSKLFAPFMIKAGKEKTKETKPKIKKEVQKDVQPVNN